MSKKRAALETLIASILIPLSLWVCVRLTMFGSFGGAGLLIIAFFGLNFVYYHVIFMRHKDTGKLCVFLTMILSTLIQFAVIIAEIASLGPLFSSGEGHPNGDAILILVILFLQPALYDVGSLFLWISSKIIAFFSEDDGDEKQPEKGDRA